MDNIGVTLQQYGIQLISVDTKKLDLPTDNKQAVYDRMISERDKIATTYIAEGNSEAQVIRNTTDQEIAISVSNAQASAASIEAEGEAEYMRIIAAAYSDETRTEFYAYVRSLEALENSIKDGNSTIILSADSPIAKTIMGQ